MPRTELLSILARLEAWPEHAQQQALMALQAIEQELNDPYELTEEDKVSIARGLADAEAGRFATEEEMEELFARYRLP